MAVLDWPAPLFAFIDRWWSHGFSPVARLALWGVLCAAVSMGIYRLIAPRAGIRRARRDAAEARRQLEQYDGELSGALPMMGRQIGAALREVFLIGPPTLIAVAPVLALAFWLDTFYGHYFPPPPQTPAIRVVPSGLTPRWQMMGMPAAQAAPPRVQLYDRNDALALDIPLHAPVTAIYKRQWWNALAGNPAGYLPDDAAVERIELDLPERQYLHFGPAWLRTWEFPFFAAFCAVALLLRRLVRMD